MSVIKRLLGLSTLTLALAVRCSSSSAPATPPKAAPSPVARCRGTLGIEVRSAAGQFKGAVVTEVLPGGPGASAGLRVNDVVEQIGSTRLANACEFTDLAYNRTCDPVRVLVRRAGAGVELMLTPVDQAALYEQACRGGIASACFREGWLLWNRKGDANSARVLELFASACKAGSGEACAYEGLDRMGSADHGAAAVPVLERACELSSAGGCANLAFLYAMGKFVKKDDRRSASLYAKSCDLGDAQGCYNAGLMADDGRGVARDPARAAVRYAEACEMGSATGCTNLGFLYENGRGVKMDKARAHLLYQRGCEGSSCQPSNLGGCVNAGRGDRDGIGVPVDETKAAAMFRDACDRAVNPDDIHAAENGSRACSLLGALYIAGDGIPKDLQKGLELSVLGCDRGDAFGCFNAAAVYTAGAGLPADAAKADSYLDLACKGGDGEGCYD
ncbi:MAG TPA: PDZ domain-containing protein, partial [Thermoanaerobaculia bacterium]|nr:PDZ domain-containing protein [Thermoanaerobaculia bacterium]